MKKYMLLLISLCLLSTPVWAQNYHVEVLQVSDIGAFDQVYENCVNELASAGLIAGKNLTINRHIVDAAADAGLWKKIGVLTRIKKKANEIVDLKPDLVITISTPATKYSMQKIIDAGIPLVFTAVANPPLVGCKTYTEAGPGFTGVTLYIDPIALTTLAKMVMPQMQIVGMIHSDDDNAIAFSRELQAKAAKMGIAVLTREVDKSDKIEAMANELLAEGVDTFALPLDAYYNLRDSEAGRDLFAFGAKNNLPVIAYAAFNVKGALLYAGQEFSHIGMLTGKQVEKILLEGVAPGSLPVLRQENMDTYVDSDIAAKLGITIPPEVLQIAKTMK